MLAAYMGISKDKYYDDFQENSIGLGVRVLNPIKKSFHKVNYLRVVSVGDLAKKWKSDLRGDAGRIQTPFEIITPIDLRSGEVAYQVFIKAGDDLALFRKVKHALMNEKAVFNPCLGAANMNAQFYGVELHEAEEAEVNDFLDLHSATPTEHVEKLHFEEGSDDYSHVEEDLFPGSFLADNNRELASMNRLLFSTTDKALKVKLHQPFWKLKSGGKTLNIKFIEK